MTQEVVSCISKILLFKTIITFIQGVYLLYCEYIGVYLVDFFNIRYGKNPIPGLVKK